MHHHYKYKMSSGDADTSTTESDYSNTSGSDVSTASLQQQLESMRQTIGSMYSDAERIELHLYTLQRPMESLAINQLGVVPFLASSPFRHHTFSMKTPGIPDIDIQNRYPFHIICKHLRNYLFAENAVAADGTITLTEDMKTLFGIQNSTITYLELIGHLRNIVI